MNARRAALFLSALVVTFVITRGYLYFAPNADFDIGQYNIHHLFTGLVLITLFGIPLMLFHGNSRLLDASTVGFGAGMSLSLDEWVYLIATDGSNTSYWLPVSFWGGVIVVVLAAVYTVGLYVLRNSKD